MSIYLIRHGETPSNRARVVQVPETPLSDRGIAQARRLAGRLAEVGIEQILSSDLTRAAMTAQALAEASGAPTEYDPLLQERNFGDIRGTAYADLDQNPFSPDYAPPGGEGWAAFHRRVDAAWEKVQALADRLEGHLAVVTHGLVCHSVVARHVELPVGVERPGRDGPPFHFGNTSLTIVTASAPRRVELLDCTVHLDQRDDPEGISGL